VEFSKKLVNTNAIKPKTRFCPKSIEPPGILAKIQARYTPCWIFQFSKRKRHSIFNIPVTSWFLVYFWF
jgi:hypothetical protein